MMRAFLIGVGGLATLVVFGFEIARAQNDAVDTTEISVGDVHIIQVQTGGESGAKDDFIVLQNLSKVSVDLTGWSMRKCTGSKSDKNGFCYTKKDSTSLFTSNLKNVVLEPGEVWKYEKASQVVDEGSIALFDNSDDGTNEDKPNKNGKIISSLIWGEPSNVFAGAPQVSKATDCEMIIWDEKGDKYILIRQKWVACEIVEYSGEKVVISEVLPNPSGDESKGEFIELYNPGNKMVSLRQWQLRDSAKSTKPYIFDIDATIKAKSYLVVMRNDFKFALNNSGGETVTLLAPDDTVVSTMLYDSAKEDVSWNFTNDNGWRASSTLTPGARNIVSAPLQIAQIDIDGDIYRDIPASFRVIARNAGDSKLKVRWEFGNGRKSYKQNTTHKYIDKGVFAGTVRVSNDIEEVTQSFTVKVRKYPAHNVRISEILPNPTGKDTGVEYVRLINKSGQKLNLKGWSVATGADEESLVNHPIREKLVIGHKKDRRITTKRAAITLRNTSGVVQLRRPDGSVAHTKKYKYDGNIPENARYAKQNRQWQWDLSDVPVAKTKKSTKKKKSKKSSVSAQDTREIIATAWDNEFVLPAAVLGVMTATSTNTSPITVISSSRSMQIISDINSWIAQNVFARAALLRTQIYQIPQQIFYASSEEINTRALATSEIAQNSPTAPCPQPTNNIPIHRLALSLATISPCTITELLTDQCVE